MDHPCTTVDASAEPPLEGVEDLYGRLERFIWWKAHQITDGNRSHVLLGVDDLAGEMFLTLVQCWDRYASQEQITAGDMVRLVMRSCDNTCRSLLRMYYYNRPGELDQVSIDEVWDVAVECDVDAVLESQNRISTFIESLTRREREIVIAILTMDERLVRTAHLETVRRDFVYASPGPLAVNYRLLADALQLDYRAAKSMWYRIKKKWVSFQRNLEKDKDE